MTSDNTQTMMAYDARKKSALIAYVLWFCLGGLGAHNFYIGRTSVAITQLVLMLLGILTAVFIVGFFLIIPVCLWVLIDAFIIPGNIERYNTALAASLGTNVPTHSAEPARYTAQDLSAEMESLQALRRSGAISDAEFEEKRIALLAKLK